MLTRLAIFLLLNFGGLALGAFMMGEGPSSDWYELLNKAPWTPPGWVFGFAWTLIMLCFSVYLALLWPNVQNLSLLIGFYAFELILNISWNPIFFYFHQPVAGFAVIITLTLLIAFFLVFYWPSLQAKSALILPYLVWLLIATSLNGYVVFQN